MNVMATALLFRMLKLLGDERYEMLSIERRKSKVCLPEDKEDGCAEKRVLG